MTDRLAHALVFIDTDHLQARVNALKQRDNARAKKYNKKRRQSDGAFRMLCNLRSRVRSALKCQGIRRREERTVPLLGCSVAQAMLHIEKQFRRGMSWDNFGVVWEIDHIRPCRSFNLKQAAQRAECFRFTNLQPLFISENRSKGARFRLSEQCGLRPRS